MVEYQRSAARSSGLSGQINRAVKGIWSREL